MDDNLSIIEEELEQLEVSTGELQFSVLFKLFVGIMIMIWVEFLMSTLPFTLQQNKLQTMIHVLRVYHVYRLSIRTNLKERKKNTSFKTFLRTASCNMKHVRCNMLYVRHYIITTLARARCRA